MKENYMISILGIQQSNGEEEKIDLKTVGSYFNKGNKKYIVYREFDESNPTEKITTVLSVDDSTVTLRRIGDNSNSLILEKGRRHKCLYNTIMGELRMGIFTYEMKDRLYDNGGELYARYDIDFNAEYASQNKLYIKVESKENILAGDKENVENSSAS